MNHDWHVLYSRYLERVWRGSVTGATRREKADAKIMHDVAEDGKLCAIGQMWEVKQFYHAAPQNIRRPPRLEENNKPR